MDTRFQDCNIVAVSYALRAEFLYDYLFCAQFQVSTSNLAGVEGAMVRCGETETGKSARRVKVSSLSASG